MWALMKAFLLLVFWCLWFFNFSSRTILSPLLPVLESDLGITHTLAGSFFFFLSAGYTLSLLAAGWLTSRIGFKRAIVSANLLFAISLLFLRLGTSYAYIATVSFFMGLGSGLYLPSAVPLLTSIFRRESWGKAIAFHETAPSFSLICIPLLTAFSLEFFSWQHYILVFAGACALFTAVFMVSVPAIQGHEGKKIEITRILTRRVFWVLAAVWCTASSSVIVVYNFIPLMLVNERGVSIETANTVLGISRVGGFIATFLVGFLLDRYGVRILLFLSLLLTGLSTMGIALAGPFPVLIIVFIIQAVASLVFFPIGLVGISKITDTQERSAFTGGIMAASVILGGGVAPFVMGVVADIWGFQVGILMLGVIAVLSPLALISLRDLKEGGGP